MEKIEELRQALNVCIENNGGKDSLSNEIVVRAALKVERKIERILNIN